MAAKFLPTTITEPDAPPNTPDLPSGPAADTVQALADVLADVLHTDRIPPDSNFFDDLGADSLNMAHFCARLRKRPDLPTLSIKDVYQHPTLHRLAGAYPGSAPPAEPAPASVPGAPVPGAPLPARTGTAQVVRCGFLQAMTFLAYVCGTAWAVAQAYEWIDAGSGLADVYLRSVLSGGVLFLGACGLPILAKWVLVGRWKPRRIRIWSLAYVRFWAVRILIQSNPLVLFAGSPLYVLYLRALGAHLGRGVAVFSRHLPVCTDLLTVGDGSVIRKDSYLTCYRARSGWIETGPVTLGKNVYVSEATVLDIDCRLGDGAQLGHASSLHSGQAVPPGESWHGTPARRAGTDFRTVPHLRCGRSRRAVFGCFQLLSMLLVLLPSAVGGATLLLTGVPQLSELLGPGASALSGPAFYVHVLLASAVLFTGFVVGGLLLLCTLPRLLALAVRPDKVYPLYGVHYWVHRVIARLTGIRFFTYLFGDSSAIVHYLRALGYHLTPVEQTGSNFGLDVRHETPYLSAVGTGTMVADGLSLMNADYSSTSFRVSRVTIGAHNFLGNYIAYPVGGRTGDNCLLATKVMVPVDGALREGVGLLGSPSFEIPRTVRRDAGFELSGRDELHRRLSAKNRHNAVTMVLYLLVRYLHVLGLTLIAGAAIELYHALGPLAIASQIVLTLAFTVGWFVLVERAVIPLQTLRPEGCSIYERAFWRHERFWKVPSHPYMPLLNGTPFKPLIWRLLGARVGSRVFDDGCLLMEKTFVTIGDDCALNVGSIVQCHSQEDGAFKSDRIAIGSGCTLGVGALVHYGVTVHDGATLTADCFLMKGEVVPPDSRWEGNPAQEAVGAAR
ncbi:hypothetical protein GCM10010129_33650 [Streptomyces fumigatiscleroticus]|nr:hypothetical protein GCM10010129_33650 [Streptomyces fumigatiscleroticus]